MPNKQANDGGPAFPTDHSRDEHYTNITGGMSLRDYFAAQALPGVLQARALMNGPDAIGTQEDVAEECYEIADAMVLERQKPEEEE
jgi:hypothetical protein